MDVTQQIQRNHLVYGASDYTAPGGLSASKSLNYAKGASITKPDRTSVTVIPYALRYADSVGLFGAENYFLRVDLDITEEIARVCFEEPYWQCAYINYHAEEEDYGWKGAEINEETPGYEFYNDYYTANIIPNRLPKIPQGYISIELTNIKSGNKFQDDWLDVRLYTQDREEHPHNKMYIQGKGYFYIGVHARNTKRLPYDILCVIGREYRNYDSIEDKSLIMRRPLRQSDQKQGYQLHQHQLK